MDLKGEEMARCWLCHEGINKESAFCYNCKMPQGNIIDLALGEANGLAKVKCNNGKIYETTWQNGKRTSIQEMA